MKHIFSKLFTLILFLISATLFYLSFTVMFQTFLMNICLSIIAIFFLLQASSRIDKNICNINNEI